MKSKISKISSAVGFALLAPMLAFAQLNNTTTGEFNGSFFENAIKFVNRTITSLFPIITAVLVLIFGYLVIKFLTTKEIEDKEVYKSNLIKALLAIFLWFTLFGLINLLANAVGVEVGSDVGADAVPTVMLPM